MEDPCTSDGLMKEFATRSLEALTDKLVATWPHTADQLRKEVTDLGTRTSHMEQKVREIASTYNELVVHVQALKGQEDFLETWMADTEERVEGTI
ncbi:Hypothetical predicted protein [Pelobates cultripes]|uniref:Uncharacterized protein n=1 Tax=Pelobates cultripes TaxID=61616 RepID=A0AAD1SMT6_PELCU|nr:Hypothetical predicted protein [Pelobates cultripes]